MKEESLGSAARRPAGRAAPGPLRVLLVEDSDLQARVIQDELVASGGDSFSVERAACLAAGLERLSSADAVLLDLNLPDSQGVETFARISSRTPDVPVIVLTVSDDDELAMEALRRGAQDYLVKSRVGNNLLPRVIRYAVERKRVDAALRKARDELELRVRERTLELTMVNERLRQRSDDLERANYELSLFASVASHELQEPLRKIVTYGELLELRCAPSLDPKGLEYLRTMRMSAARQRELIVSLRELTEITTAPHPLEPVDLDDILKRALADLEPELRSSGARVDAARLPRIKGDSLQLQQLFYNLLDNSVKYRDKSRPLVIRVSSRPAPGDGLELSVEDNGTGFEQRYAEQIFKPFQRLRSRAEIEGIGMGLALCARIVWRHGGKIAAVGKPGAGATFTVTLPAPPSGAASEPLSGARA